MLYSQTTNGFYHPSIHGENIPVGAVSLTEEEYASLMEGQTNGLLIAPDSEGRPSLVSAPPADTTTQSVTMRQARLALLGAGLLDDVNAAIAAIQDTTQRRAAEIEWEYAQTVDRASPFTQQLASGLGLTSEQLDGLFTQAAAL